MKGTRPRVAPHPVAGLPMEPFDLVAIRGTVARPGTISPQHGPSEPSSNGQTPTRRFRWMRAGPPYSHT